VLLLQVLRAAGSRRPPHHHRHHVLRGWSVVHPAPLRSQRPQQISATPDWRSHFGGRLQH